MIISNGDWFERHANKKTTGVLNTVHLLMGMSGYASVWAGTGVQSCTKHIIQTVLHFLGFDDSWLTCIQWRRHWTEGSMSICRLKHLAGWWRRSMMKRPRLGQSCSVWSPGDIFVSVARFQGICDVKPCIWCDMIQKSWINRWGHSLVL